MQVPADLQDTGDPGMLRVKAGPGEGGGALISEGGPLVRAPPRCGRASTPIHSTPLKQNLLGHPTVHVSPLLQKVTACGNSSKRRRCREWAKKSQKEPRRGPETAEEAPGFLAPSAPAPNSPPPQLERKGPGWGEGCDSGWVQRAQSRKWSPEGDVNLSPPPLAQGKRVNVTRPTY